MTELDVDLVERAKGGNTKAFEILVRKYQGRVAAVISRTVSDHDRVQDLTQETFLKAYRALNGFRGDSAFFTWLYRIAINTAKNYLISSGRGIPDNDLELGEVDQVAPELRETDTPEASLLRGELMENLRLSIAKLTPAMREAIMLRELQGMSYEEIAERMACPIGTVRSRIFRGRQEIADIMKNYIHHGIGKSI
ncbi:MAG: sigma-70 family RNA polymerase sigma factor [Magnetococcales bacterium]|nr:sigma-70 family RNA polymerase sigma factor [Magnetococcales bacterium]